MSEQPTKLPNPGSREAIAQGCKCPRMDNGYGRGYMGIEGEFVRSELCPLHGAELREEKEAERVKASLETEWQRTVASFIISRTVDCPDQDQARAFLREKGIEVTP